VPNDGHARHENTFRFEAKSQVSEIKK